MIVRGVLRSFLCAVSAAAFLLGCSTTIKSKTIADEQESAEERAALVDAAAKVAEAKWPKPSSSSFADRLAGVDLAAKRVSRDDATKAYVATLKASADPQAALAADAERHLIAARALKEVAEIACDGARPRLSDVALIEDAISDLRETRSIYVASIKKLDSDDDEEDALKDAFDAILKDLGDVADSLAENAMKQSSENFAGSGAERVAGSL